MTLTRITLTSHDFDLHSSTLYLQYGIKKKEEQTGPVIEPDVEGRLGRKKKTPEEMAAEAAAAEEEEDSNYSDAQFCCCFGFL